MLGEHSFCRNKTPPFWFSARFSLVREHRHSFLHEEDVSAPAPAAPSQVTEFQRQMDELLQERDLLRATQIRIPREPPGVWCAGGPPRVQEIANEFSRVGRLDQRAQFRPEECTRIRDSTGGCIVESGHSQSRSRTPREGLFRWPPALSWQPSMLGNKLESPLRFAWCAGR